jgi:hypothetical protein
MTSPAHNPGSLDARIRGCTCSVDLNHKGAGEPINNGQNRRWTAALGCLLHSSWPAYPEEVTA